MIERRICDDSFLINPFNVHIFSRFMSYCFKHKLYLYSMSTDGHYSHCNNGSQTSNVTLLFQWLTPFGHIVKKLQVEWKTWPYTDIGS